MKRRVAVTDPDSVRSARHAHLRSLVAAGKAFDGFRPASEALTRVRAVPTIFPQFDLATRVGGLPTERFTLLHGQSAGGKTFLTLALILSFLQRDFPAYLIDAERTSPISWIEKVFGDEYAAHPLFFADRPDVYEQVRIDVRTFCKKVAALREDGVLDTDATALIVVDSIRKMVPKDQWDAFMKEVKEAEGKEGSAAEKAHSRISQRKAQMNAMWVDEIVPLLEKTGCAMVVIAREIMDPDNTNPKAIKAKTNVKTGGGGALFYDASLDLQTRRVGFYGKTTGTGDGERMTPWGTRYRIDITKTKVAGQGEDFRTSCFFHISNGAQCPEGFDRAKDLLEIARRFDVIEGTSWLKYGSRKWQGEERVLNAMRADASLSAAIEAATRACFKLEKTRETVA